jgi:ABC-type phosphate/phosphonate transport system ATPase subunit
MITFQNVTEHYDNGSIEVNGLSLVAPCGKITVFVGPSGCGKTTLLRMINRLLEPSSGFGDRWISCNCAAVLAMSFKMQVYSPQKHYRQHCHHRDSQRRQK